MATDRTIQIKELHTLDEMREAAELQHVYWGNDSESIVPAHMLYTIATYGGHVIAAMDDNKMIGVLIGLLGTNVEEQNDRPAMANLLIASKRMVVLPEYRSGGLGYRLKLMQRDLAIKQGVRLVTWTFDPLRSANAHLNIRKLGTICQRYHVNYYGQTEFGGLVQHGWSDRLRVDWWVTNRRVQERLNGSRADLTLAQYMQGNATLVNPTHFNGQFIVPSGRVEQAFNSFALVEIPMDIDTIAKTDTALMKEWQAHIRVIFITLMGSGFIITDFLRDKHEGRDRAFYLLSRNLGYDFSVN